MLLNVETAKKHLLKSKCLILFKDKCLNWLYASKTRLAKITGYNRLFGHYSLGFFAVNEVMRSK